MKRAAIRRIEEKIFEKELLLGWCNDRTYTHVIRNTVQKVMSFEIIPSISRYILSQFEKKAP